MSDALATAQPDAFVLDRSGLERLMGTLIDDGYRLLAPTIEDGVLAVRPVSGLDAVACGWRSEDAPGSARLQRDGAARPLAIGLPAQGWKAAFYPPHERLLRARRAGAGFVAEDDDANEAPLALFGVRACDLASFAVLDRVLAAEPPADPRYRQRRRESFVVAATCLEPGATCFCESMGTGPEVGAGADLILLALTEGDDPPALVSAGSARGAALLQRLDPPPATARQVAAGEAARARIRFSRRMAPGIAGILQRHAGHGHWQEIAGRCLACGNCTAVCPTCFCTTIEDATDLGGTTAERWRRWDSCFTLAFTFLHGGSVRASAASRYRHWMTHKLSSWWDQFGCSGCVGCGRCITWCPVGIDITAEADAFAAFDRGVGS